MEKVFSVPYRDHSIKCRLYCNDARSISAAVVCCHGFGGCKENAAFRRFAEKLLSKKKSWAVLAFDWPCHGEDVKKKLRLADCADYLTGVTEYLQNKYAGIRLYAYGVSFGGYNLLRQILLQRSPFLRIALRCPAVPMYETTMDLLPEQQKSDLLRGREVLSGFDKKIPLDPVFIEELKANDLTRECFLEDAENILILHGTKDETVPFDRVRAFADDNCIEFIPVQNADHRFTDPDLMGAAIARIVAFLTEA